MEAPKKTKKKTLIIGIVTFLVLALGAGGYYVLTQSQKPEYQVGTISERSEEFLKSQKEDTSNELYSADFTPGAKRDVGQAWPVGECFEITIPAQVIDTKEIGPCSAHFFLDQPKANVVVSLAQVGYADLEENPGIKMRRNEKEKYKEQTKKISDHTFHIFKVDSEIEYESSAFALIEGKLFTASITASSNVNFDKTLLKVLESFQLQEPVKDEQEE